MSELICPKCGSSKLRRSRTRNFWERLMRTFHRKAYRCKDCGWRGLLKQFSD